MLSTEFSQIMQFVDQSLLEMTKSKPDHPDLDGMIKNLSEAIRDRPDRSSYFSLATAYMQAGEIQEAMIILDMLQSSIPDSEAKAYRDLIQILQNSQEQKDPEDSTTHPGA